MGTKAVFSRRKFLLGAAGAVTAGGFYARFAESQRLRVSRHDVLLEEKNPPIRIVQLSDLHASSVVPLEFIAEAVTLALAQKPDLIALTGDFVTDSHAGPDGYAPILARLAAAAPTFGCLGNHDSGAPHAQAPLKPTIKPVVDLLTRANIPCLVNESHALTVRGRPLQLIGVGDLWSGLCDPAKAFAEVPARAGATRIVLNHNPDAKDMFYSFDWDLMLCGHTHGGQVRLPFFGTPFAPVTDKRYIEGLHRWEKRWLHITRGVGNLHGVRINCRPEISVLDLA